MPRKRTKEQNRAIYERRKQRAITEGYSGYGQKRYRTDKSKQLQAKGESLEKQLSDKYPGIVPASQAMDLPKDRQNAYNRLVASGLFTQEELQQLLNAPSDQFWQLARPMLEATSP